MLNSFNFKLNILFAFKTHRNLGNSNDEGGHRLGDKVGWPLETILAHSYYTYSNCMPAAQLHACRRDAFTDWVWLVVYWEWLGTTAEDCLALLENLPQDMINMLMKWQ